MYIENKLQTVTSGLNVSDVCHPTRSSLYFRCNYLV